MTTSESRKSLSDVTREHALVRDVGPGLLALLLTQGSLVTVNPGPARDAWHVAWALSPMPAVLWMVWAQWRSLRRADEYQRGVQLAAMAVGFGTTLTAAMFGGLLDAADLGSARQSLQVTVMVGVLAWVGSLAVSSRRVA